MCIPVFQDFVEDNVRLRCLSVLAATFMFVVAAFSFSWTYEFRPVLVSSVSFSSTPTTVAYMSYTTERVPRVQVVNDFGTGLKDIPVEVSVGSLVQLTSRNTLTCDSMAMDLIIGTLEHERIKLPCTPVVAGTKNVTDSIGLAQFPQFQFVAGPPGLYVLSFSAGGHAAEYNMGVASNVFDAYPLNDPPNLYEPGVPLSVQPALSLTDNMHQPIVGRRVTAFVWPTPYFFDAGKVQQINRHGQQFATLLHAISEPSDKNGTATFRNLTIAGTSTSLLYLYFYIEGHVVSWMNENDRPSALRLPSVPQYAVGLPVKTNVSAVEIVQGPPTLVDEGRAFTTQPTIKVKDVAGVGVKGRLVYALITVAGGFVFPDLNVPAVSDGRLFKSLVNAVSAETDEFGVATFKGLAFQVAGSADGAFRLVFVCDGVHSPETPDIHVRSSVARVIVQSVPAYIPHLQGDAASNSDDDAQAVVSVRVVDDAGRGIPGKWATIALVRGNGEPIDPAQCAISASSANAGSVSHVTGADGFLSLPLVFNYQANSTVFDITNIRLVFTVDGVSSAPSPQVLIDRVVLPQVPVFLRTIVPPPPSVRVGEAFGFSVMAVDSFGTPVAGVTAAAIEMASVGMYANKPDMFVMAAVFETSAHDGIVHFHGLVFTEAPPSGTALLWAIEPTSVAFYGDFLFINVTNNVATVLVEGVGPEVNAINIGVLVSNSTEGTIQVLDKHHQPVTGAHASLMLAQVPLSVPLVQITDGNVTTSGGMRITKFGNPVFATFYQSAAGSGADGKLKLSMTVQSGVVGTWVISLAVQGVRSAPIQFSIQSPVAKLTWVQQPTSGHLPFVRLGNYLPQQPSVLVTDEHNRPLPSYTVNAGWVTDDWESAPAMVDLVTDSCSNLLGLRQSNPADSHGVATFDSIVFLDALSGCYRLVAYHCQDGGATAASGLSNTVCVTNSDTLSITQQPSLATSNGAKFATPITVTRKRSYESDLDKAGLYLAAIMIDSYQSNLRSADDRSVSALTPNDKYSGNFATASYSLSSAWLDNNVCVFSDFHEIMGLCPDATRRTINLPIGTDQYSLSVTFTNLLWDNGFPQDTLRFRAYSPILFTASEDLNANRDANMTAGCSGPIARGSFGQCCDSDAQCDRPLVCNTQERTCTKRCNDDSDCPPSPRGSNSATLSGWGQCKFDGMCDATSIIGWSFSPYCKYCESPSYTGRFAPAAVEVGLQAVSLVNNTLIALDSALQTACNNPVMTPICMKIPALLAPLLARRIADMCVANPALQTICDGGITAQTVQEGLKLMAKLVVQYGSEIEPIIDELLAFVFTQPPGSLPGRSDASQKVIMQSAPALVAIVSPPPEYVTVGDLFEVIVRVTIASGAPVPHIKVHAEITSIVEGNSLISVENFVSAYSGHLPLPSEQWDVPELDATRQIASTDAQGVARFRLRITSAKSGNYVLVFTANSIMSVKSRIVKVTNNAQTIDIVSQPTSKVSVEDFSHFQPIDGPAIQVLDMNSNPMAGKRVNVFVIKIDTDPDAVTQANSLYDTWGKLTASQKVTAIAKLLVQGARQLQLFPPPAANAEITPNSGVTDQQGKLSLQQMRIKFSDIGTYRLVFTVDGFASQPSGDIVVDRIDTTSVEYQVIAGVLKGVLFLSVAMVFMGNSTWHRGWVLVISMAATAVYLAFTIPLTPDSEIQRYLMFVLLGCLAIGLIAVTLVTLLRRKFRTFAQRRRDAYFAYTANVFRSAGLLLARPPKPAPPTVQAAVETTKTGGGSGGGSAVHVAPTFRVHEPLRRLMNAQKEKADETQRERSYLVNMRQVIKSVIHFDDSAAFFYPTRLTSALTIGFVAIAFLFVACLQSLLSLQDICEAADAAALRTVLKGIAAMEELAASKLKQDLLTDEVQFGYDQAYKLHEEFLALSDALFIAFIVGSVAAILVYLVSTVVLLLDFRVQVLTGRRGQFQWNRAKVRVADASNFVGIAITNGLLIFIVILTLVAGVVLPFAWKLTRDLIFAQWDVALAILAPTLVNVVLKKIFGYHLLTTAKPWDHIRFRRGYMIFDLVMFFVLMYTSITTSLVRFILVVVIALVSLPRLDRSPMPAWVERYLLLDAGSKSYQGVVLQYHAHNNPIARTAAWIFEQRLIALRARAASLESQATPYAAEVAHMHAAIRWRLAWTLYRNPGLKKFRNLPEAAVDAVTEFVGPSASGMEGEPTSEPTPSS